MAFDARRLSLPRPSLNNYAYGSFTALGPVAALGASLTNFWTADDHGTARMTDDGAGVISAWSSQVNAVALAAATTARPTWSATSFNSAYAGVTGDGVANAMTVASVLGEATGTNESWIIVLVSQPTGSTTRNIFGYGAATASAGRLLLSTTANRLQVSNVTAVISDTAHTLVGYHLIAGNWIAGGATASGQFDGMTLSAATVATSTNTSTTRTGLFGGIAASAANFGTATVRYIFVTGALTQLQLWQIGGWAMWQSGLNRTVLRSDHPFRYRQP